MSSTSKIRRPLLAALLVMGLGVNAASAYDFCNPCAPAPAPVVRTVATCSNPCGVQPMAAPIMAPAPAPSACYPTACPSSPSESGSYSAYYSSNYSGVGSGITYLIPTTGGLVESQSPDLPYTNDVDNYYATHDVVNGQVQQVPYHIAGRW